jgi:hypothetical protein
MSRKLCAVITVLLVVLFISSPGWSSVVGSWSVQGKVRTCVTIVGHTVCQSQANVADYLTFQPDGGFTMTGGDGTWIKQPSSGFKVSLNRQQIKSYFAQYGITVTRVQQAGITGRTVSSVGIRGTMTLAASFKYGGYSGVVRSTYPFTGSRTAALRSGSEAPAILGSMAEEILEEAGK